MPAVKYKFKSNLAQELGKFGRALDDAKRTFYANASIVMHRGVVGHFEKSIDEGGRRWKKRKGQEARGKRTNNRKGRRNDWPLLQKNGRLLGSIVPKSSTKKAQVLTNVEYAATHNFGSRSRNIPRRQYMYVDEKTMDNVMAKLEQQISRLA